MNVPILFRLSERGKYEDRLLDEEVVIPADENLSGPSIPEDRALENLAATESAQRT